MINELNIIQDILSGKTELYVQLIDAHKDRLFNFIFRMTGNNQEAEDITQESFIKAYKNLKNFKIQYKFSTWLYAIAHNITQNYLKRRNIIQFFSLDKTREQENGSTLEWEFADNALTPEQISIKKEETKKIHKLIQSLNQKYREIFLLRYQVELSYQEIAEITGLPMGTVETRLHRATQQLTRKYREYFNAEQ